MPRVSLRELRRLYVDEGRPLPSRIEQQLRADPRAGARAIVASVERRRRENRCEGQRLRKMLRFESELWTQGVTRVAGVDEAGMSPLAGPVVAAAVVLPVGWRARMLDDSKKLHASARAKLAEIIKAEAVCWSVGFAEPEEIDRINIYWAGLLAMRRAVDGLESAPQHLLIDARRLEDLDTPQQPIVKGDQKSLSIAAASIIAKTTRDAHMQALDDEYPGYGFAQHKGYPVPQHKQALRRLGPSLVHRRSFTVVREAYERAAGVNQLAQLAFDLETGER